MCLQKKNNSDLGHIPYKRPPSDKVITDIKNKSMSKGIQANVNNKVDQKD